MLWNTQRNAQIDLPMQSAEGESFFYFKFGKLDLCSKTIVKLRIMYVWRVEIALFMKDHDNNGHIYFLKNIEFITCRIHVRHRLGRMFVCARGGGVLRFYFELLYVLNGNSFEENKFIFR